MSEWAVFARRALLTVAEEALREVGIHADVFPAGSMEQLAAAIRSEGEAGRKRYAVVGDDQIVGEALNALMRLPWREPPVLGILPANGGSDFARTFGIPQRLDDAARQMAGDAIFVSDVGVIEGSWGRRYFVNLAMAGATFTGRGRRTTFTLVTGRRTYEGMATGALFTNGQFAGGGMRVAPRATVIDGELDVQTWDVRSRDRPGFLNVVRDGGHLKDKRVRRTSTPAFEMITERPWPVTADGTYVGTTPVSGRAVARAIAMKI